MQHAQAPHEDETVACAATAASAAVGAWCQSKSPGMSSSGWHVMRGECTTGHKSPRLPQHMSRTSHQMSRTLPDVPICHLELAHICPGQAESGIFEAQSGIPLVVCTTHTEPGNSMTPLGGLPCAYISITEGCDGLVAAPIAYQAMTQVSRALANVPRCGKYVPDSAPACPERGYFGTPNVPQLAVGAKSFPVVRVCIRGGCLQACLAAQ